ncbi:sporulation protein [Nonomuraea sp. NPDC049709]|uniref:sporulation protein n=1 Tax=Nonomuraea sp. NPDC049709 TaxID=3154736 RepID=UPI003441840A
MGHGSRLVRIPGHGVRFSCRSGVGDIQVDVPWETPISEIGGRHLNGMALGVRTEAATATAVGKSGLVLVAVRPSPSQQHVQQAFARLGFPFKSAALQAGRLNHGLATAQVHGAERDPLERCRNIDVFLTPGSCGYGPGPH